MKGQGTLKSRTISGLFWSFAGLFSNQGIQFVILMLMARLLTPEDFGVIGMIIVFIAISNSLVDSGFSQALIREKEPAQKEYSTVFFYNLSIALFMYGLIFLLSPVIADFFHTDKLVSILRVVSLGIIINSLGIIHRVILIRSVNFKLQTQISVVAAILAGIVAIAFAILGFGVWSLVAQSLLMQAIQILCLWMFNKWRPRLIFDKAVFSRLFGFGSKLLFSGLIDTIFNNIYAVIIARLYPLVQLGYYTNAVKLGEVVTNSTTGALQRVTYPVLSSIQNDETRLQSSFRKIIQTSAYIMFPIMIGLIAVGDSLIPLLLGPQWVGSILYFQLLCVAGMIYPIHAINLNILQVKGRSDLFLKLEIIKKTLLTLLIMVSLFFSLGIIGLIVAAITCSYISLFINTYYSSKEIDYSTKQQMKDLLPAFILSISMGAFVTLVSVVLPDQILIRLLIQITSGVLFYCLISWLLRLKEFSYLSQLGLSFFKSSKRKLLKSS